MYWDREDVVGGSGHAWLGSLPGSKILAGSACMSRFEAVLADAEVRRPRVACDPQMKDGSKQLSRKSSAIRLQPDRGPLCLSEHNAPSIVPTLFSVRTKFCRKAGRAPVKPGEVGKRALFARF